MLRGIKGSWLQSTKIQKKKDTDQVMKLSNHTARGQHHLEHTSLSRLHTLTQTPINKNTPKTNLNENTNTPF